ncbi:MAG: 50S ribosomal protein L11 methyltransferase [Thiotrichales bacterium]|nr:50S ribosomal protein L11 methyltransferase [Thiotrichales bacterium]
MNPAGRTWFELVLECGRTGLDAVCEHLETAGAVSVTLEDAGDDPQLEPKPGATPLWPQVRVRALYEHAIGPEIARSALPDTATVTVVRVRQISDRDWLAASLEDIVPIEVGALWIGPHRADPPPDRVVVRLEPGLAFGSGRHPTTWLCLEWLARKFGCFPTADAPPAELDVIDYGCGSGILAVTAAVFGASRVTAIDIDPQALRATAENARANGVSDRVSVVPAETAAKAPVRPASLVVANILADPLMALAPTLADLTIPGGDLALSGILEAQADEVADAFGGAFDIRTGGRSEEWVRLDGRRREER